MSELNIDDLGFLECIKSEIRQKKNELLSHYNNLLESLRHDNFLKNNDLIPLIYDLKNLNIDGTISYIINDEYRNIDVGFYNFNYKEVCLEGVSGKISSIHTNIYTKINSTEADEKLTWRKYHALFKNRYVETYALDECHIQTIGNIEREFEKPLHTKCHNQIPFPKYPKYYIELKKKNYTLRVDDKICNLNKYIEIYERLYKEINEKFKMNPKFDLNKIYKEFNYKFTECQKFSKDHIQRADQYRGDNMKIQKKYLNYILHFGIRCQICKLFIQEINSKNIVSTNNVTNILCKLRNIIDRFKNKYLDITRPLKLKEDKYVKKAVKLKISKHQGVFKKAKGCKIKKQVLSQTSSDSTSSFTELIDPDEFSDDEEKDQFCPLLEETMISFDDWKKNFEEKLKKHSSHILIVNGCDFPTFLSNYYLKFNLGYWLENIYKDINYENSENETFLIYIIKNNLLPLMKVILEYDSIDINKKTSDKKNALYHAIELNRQFFVKLILNNDKVNLKNYKDIKMSYLELSINKNNYLITVELLKKKDIDVNYGIEEYPLICSFDNDNSLLPLLLECPSVDINIKSKKSELSFIEWCFHYKNFEAIKYIINNKKIIDKIIFVNLLINFENQELLNLFIENNKEININKKDSDGNTILINAIKKNLTKSISKILIVFKDKINIKLKNNENKTALEVASEYSDNKIIDLLNSIYLS